MKIALIIFRIGPSHGSILQTYALHKVLSDMGHDVTIIDRQPYVTMRETVLNCFYRLRRTIRGKYKGPIFYKGGYSKQSMSELNRFINRNLKHVIKTISTQKEVDSIIKENYDCYIVGSDQTWRPSYVYDVMYYYLNFLPFNNKSIKIAYAPSFGTSTWEYTEQQTVECAALASRFNAISVRELDGVSLCNKYLNVNAKLVLDPTMLLNGSSYSSFMESSFKCPILSYSILDNNNYCDTVISKVSGLLHLSPNRINSKCDNGRKSYVEPGIETWLSGIKQSQFVVTDSFHATVFSVLFNTPFIVIANRNRGCSRLESLLSLLGLMDRLIYIGDKTYQDTVLSSIDWNTVNDKVQELRKESLNFLINNLK